MGEFDLIAGLAPYLEGAGDDAAVLELDGTRVCLTIDVVVDGVHVDRAVSSLDDVGWKAVAADVSDLAAMGARPEAAVVGLSRPDWLDVDGVHALYRGMQAACRRWDVRLVGGDTVAAHQLSLAVAALGLAPASGAVPRGGAQPGDRLVVVGALGAAAAALAQRRAGMAPDEALLAAHRRPVALPAAGQALAAAGATAMIDVSDGLGADLGHICAASGVRARVEAAALPVAAGVEAAVAAANADLWQVVCGGGEDFALVAGVPAESADQAATEAAAVEGVAAAVVGEILPAAPGSPSVVLELADGERSLDGLGYDHFGEQGDHP